MAQAKKATQEVQSFSLSGKVNSISIPLERHDLFHFQLEKKLLRWNFTWETLRDITGNSWIKKVTASTRARSIWMVPCNKTPYYSWVSSEKAELVLASVLIFCCLIQSKDKSIWEVNTQPNSQTSDSQISICNNSGWWQSFQCSPEKGEKEEQDMYISSDWLTFDT